MDRIALPGTLALALLSFSFVGCTTVEEREGGLFSPFPDGVSGDAGHDEGGMDLPPASDFVTEEAPLVVDTGGPPAVVVGDDDSAEDVAEFDATAEVVEVEPIEVIEPPTPEPPTPEPPTPAVTPAEPVTVATPTSAVVTAVEQPAFPAHCEIALLMSAPLSEVALIATIPDAAPPRAIVRFPSGEERVVQVGDLLGDSGSKVILITAGSIKLAEVVVNEPDRPSIVTHYLHQSR